MFLGSEPGQFPAMRYGKSFGERWTIYAVALTVGAVLWQIRVLQDQPNIPVIVHRNHRAIVG